MVYQELVEEGDELSKWVKERKDSGFFVEPNEAVQNAVSQIADYVQQTCDPVQGAEFLSGADPWIIAHAMVAGGTVVTFEQPVPVVSKKVKMVFWG